MPIDLEPATTLLAKVVAGVPDDQLGARTPCTETTVGDLLDHVGGFCMAFTAAARKDFGDATSQPPGSADGSRLEAGWRDRIQRDLAGLAEAWRAPGAWQGMTQAGGTDLPGEVAGLVALDEVVLHGWDIARATAQPYEPDAESVAAVEPFVAQFTNADPRPPGLFGPAVAVPDNAPRFDRVLGMAGRDPGWSPT